MSYNWKNVLVKIDDTIESVLAKIDVEALRVALVIDEDRRLLGTITDGDIRRGFLKGANLTTFASEVMNSSPTYVGEEVTKADLVNLMEFKGLLAIPIVTNGIVVGLETLHHALEKTKYRNPVFIMAGGFGTRLRPLTDDCPKPMLKVGDKPMLETILCGFIKHGFSNFYISTHFMPEKISSYFEDGDKWGVSIKYVYEDTPLGTGGALGLLPKDQLNLPILMINGDVLTNINFESLLSYHNSNDAFATMCVREYDLQVPYGVVEGDGVNITAIEEKPIHKFFVNAGVYVLDSSIALNIKKGEKVDMPSLFEENIQKKNNVLMYPIHEYWLDIGRMEDYNRAQVDILSLGMV